MTEAPVEETAVIEEASAEIVAPAAVEEAPVAIVEEAPAVEEIVE